MKSVAIIGVGGVGSWAACAIASYAEQNNLPLSLTLIDGDCIEESNVARMFGGSTGSVGYSKVTIVRQSLLARRHSGTITIYTHGKHFTPDDLLLLADVEVIVCATDTVDIQRWLHQYCVKTGQRYIRAGYDGDTINVTTQFPLTLEDDATEAKDAGYHETPTAIPAMIAGALAAYKVWHPETAPVLLGDISRLHIADSSFVPEAIKDTLIEGAWKAKAEANDWHNGDACDIPYGYHHTDDCCQDNCIPDDYHQQGRACQEYLNDWHEAGDDCLEHVFENTSTRALIAAITTEHNAHTDDKQEWCGYCVAENQEEEHETRESVLSV